MIDEKKEDGKAKQGPFAPLRHSESVITSYSIHYTKLYEEKLAHALILHLELLIEFSVEKLVSAPDNHQLVRLQSGNDLDPAVLLQRNNFV